jgi:uncharacterized membrane protein
LGALALVLIALERTWKQSNFEFPLYWLFTTEAGGARIVLGTISGAMITATTLAFSLVIVAVMQTANAYSPRILRLYLSDDTNQNVLGILMGTFLFSLLVLRAVNTSERENFLPSLSVIMTICLSLFSIGAFIYFLDHVAHSVEVDNIISLIMRDSVDLLDDLFPRRLGQPYTAEHSPALPGDAPAVATATHSGYIQYIEPDSLSDTATEHPLLIRVMRLTGDYVLSGTPLAQVWPAAKLNETLAETICDAFQQGTERTLVQDLFFGVRQLSDIALRAISPVVNDPSTAVNVIDALGTLLVKMAQLEPISPYRCDDAGDLRVIAPGPTFEATLDLAFNQIRQYAARDYACTLRLIEVCGEIGYVAQHAAYRVALWRHVEMIARSAGQNLVEPNDRAEVNKRLLAAAEMLPQDTQSLLL